MLLFSPPPVCLTQSLCLILHLNPSWSQIYYIQLLSQFGRRIDPKQIISQLLGHLYPPQSSLTIKTLKSNHHSETILWEVEEKYALLKNSYLLQEKIVTVEQDNNRNNILLIVMGSSICAPNEIPQEFTSNPFEFIYGEDALQNGIAHEGEIGTSVKDIEANLKQCQEKLMKSSRLFKDPMMKADPVTLRAFSSKDREVKCTFERPYIFLSDPSVGRGKRYKILDYADCKPSQIVVKDDVLQYFGVFLCFLAQNPHLVKEIILTDPNTYGIVAFRVNIGSRKQYIYTDDYILCEGQTPIFSQPIKKIYMWPCLLQKAWFKIKGTITKKIEKGSPEEVYNTFLSYPIKTFTLLEQNRKHNKQLIDRHLQFLGAKNCYVTTKQQPSHKIGISGRRYFYLLKVIKFNGQALYYLRNPCSEGTMDFRGFYRNIPPEIEQRLKQQTGQLKTHEGNFILTESEFLQQIQQFTITYFSKSSQIISEEPIGIDEKQEFFISTELKSDGLISICLSQQGQLLQQNPYSPLIFNVINLGSNEIVSDQQNEDGCFGVKNTHLLPSVCQHLKAGEYLIRLKKKRNSVKKSRKPDEIKDKIVVTAPFKVKFDYKQFTLLKNKFNQFLVNFGKKKLSEKSQLKKGKCDFAHVSDWIGDIAIVYVEKINLQKEQIKIQVQFSETKNLQCLSHELKKDFTALEPFKDHLLLIFQKIDPAQQTKLGKYSIESF